MNQQQDGEIEEEKNEGGGGKAEKEEELSNIVNAGDRPDIDAILARLETLTIDKSIPEFLRENKRYFKFKSIVKLAVSNLNSIREKISEGESVLGNFSDGSIWFVGAIHSVPEDQIPYSAQLISQFFTNGHDERPRQNDEAVERFLGVCGHTNFLEAKTDLDAFKFLLSLKAIRDAVDM